MPKRNQFRIPIGDWSGDGHGNCQWYTASSASPMATVRKAYFAAKKEYPTLCPESFVREYEDTEVPAEVIELADELGYVIDYENFGPDEMAAYVVWFINLGNDAVDVRLEKNPAMLPFYGFDSEQQHIGFIGYGITSFC